MILNATFPSMFPSQNGKIKSEKVFFLHMHNRPAITLVFIRMVVVLTCLLNNIDDLVTRLANYDTF